VTTLAVNLSIGLSEHGARVVVIDADLYRSDAAALCGVAEQDSVMDVFAARRDIHEVLQRGPAGIQIVPGLWAPGESADCSDTAQERLLRQFRTLGPHADVVVLDIGNGSGASIRRFCVAADDVLLVTTPDPVAVMDTYARVKSSMAGVGARDLQLIVNLCPGRRQAADVHCRIHRSCQRFLGVRVALLGQVPEDEQVRRAAGAAVPFVLGSPACPASRAVQQLAATLCAGPQQSQPKAA
jgi:flagellar biosynthesis protein FlhG